MISRLTGLIVLLQPTETILDVAGVGYGLTTPLSVFNRHQEGDRVTLHVHTYLKEDQLRLFGFNTGNDRDLFRILISVPGIGPTMGISIFSGMTMEDIVRAVLDNEPVRFVHVPGIGKNKAEKLVFELRRKEKKLHEFALGEAATPQQRVGGDALEALVSLGFDHKTASQSVNSLIAEDPSMSLEACIKAALKRLS